MKKVSLLLISLFTMILLIGCEEPDPDPEKVEYKISFVTYSEDEFDEITIEEGKTVNNLPTPTRAGYAFLGWYTSDSYEEDFTTNTIVNKDYNLHAMWKRQYVNPVYSVSGGADPHIIRHENEFYIYVTGGAILKSDNLIDWTHAGNVFKERPNWGTKGAGFWAPDVTKIGNKYMIYYSLSVWGDSNPGIGVMSADHPIGPWVDHGKLFRSQEIGVNNSIDAQVFVAEDDRVYLIWGSFQGNYAIELTSDGLNIKNGLENASNNKIHIAGYASGVGGHNSLCYEGMYIIYKDGYYYLFASTGNCCEGLASTYKVVVARSENPTGPFLDASNQDMRNPGKGTLVMQSTRLDPIGKSAIGPGHNSIIIDDEGTYWIVYHCYYTYDGMKHNDRQVSIDRLYWTENGWPYVKDYVPSITEQDIPVVINR